MIDKLIKTYVCFSGLFMFLGALFCWHAFRTYEKARQIMETLTDIIIKNEDINK